MEIVLVPEVSILINVDWSFIGGGAPLLACSRVLSVFVCTLNRQSSMFEGIYLCQADLVDSQAGHGLAYIALLEIRCQYGSSTRLQKHRILLLR